MGNSVGNTGDKVGEKIGDKIGDDARKTRSDGAQSRERLLLEAMRLFAKQGFAATSTREIALAAETNIASISYYFGDKAGLYRAAFSALSPQACTDVAGFTDPGLALRDSLQLFYAMLLGQIKQGDRARLGLRLWFREMLEPTGLWAEQVDNGIKPAHAALMLMLGRHLGSAPARDDLERLAVCVLGLGVQMIVMRDVIDQLNPNLLASDEAVDTWMLRLVDYAEAMVHAEQARQGAQPSKKSPPKSPPRKNKA